MPIAYCLQIMAWLMERVHRCPLCSVQVALLTPPEFQCSMLRAVVYALTAAAAGYYRGVHNVLRSSGADKRLLAHLKSKSEGCLATVQVIDVARRCSRMKAQTLLAAPWM